MKPSGGRPEGKARPQSFRGVSRESHTSPGPQAGQLPAASPGDADPALPCAASALLLGPARPALVGAGAGGGCPCAAGLRADASAACALLPPVSLPPARLCLCVCRLRVGVGCMSGPPVCLSVVCLLVERHCRLCVIVGCLCFEARGEQGPQGRPGRPRPRGAERGAEQGRLGVCTPAAFTPLPVPPPVATSEPMLRGHREGPDRYKGPAALRGVRRLRPRPARVAASAALQLPDEGRFQADGLRPWFGGVGALGLGWRSVQGLSAGARRVGRPLLRRR